MLQVRKVHLNPSRPPERQVQANKSLSEMWMPFRQVTLFLLRAPFKPISPTLSWRPDIGFDVFNVTQAAQQVPPRFIDISPSGCASWLRECVIESSPVAAASPGY